jgi:hypothetical protein
VGWLLTAYTPIHLPGELYSATNPLDAFFKVRNTPTHTRQTRHRAT